ncbi:ethanolamine ammonia-lyase subunit EutC [Pseudodesulfovibrio sp.]|uniref:ethanolamine ammonia-lyase subunit EutC n=1 Tax=unclassified Pseudodesulfovibrio TaxID=2661612 RepID=UPI003B00DB4B
MPPKSRTPALNRSPLCQEDGWEKLKAFTDARIALGRAGTSLPTAAHLAFQLDHARARDAVHLPLDVRSFIKDLDNLGLPALELFSRTEDRREYLLRPDLGRRLAPESSERLWVRKEQPHDLALVVSDGLSSAAIARQALPFLTAFLAEIGKTLDLAPTTYVHRGRVAVGDEVGELLNAKMVAILIGERPGLSSPDSMGVYLTYGPRVGLTDESRNCISNVRPEGLPPAQAAETLYYLISGAQEKGLTGVNLKDEREIAPQRKVKGISKSA